MSVVNRMLQDIDLRRVAAEVESAKASKDVRSIAPRATSAPRSPHTLWSIVLLTCVLAIAALFWWQGPPQILFTEPATRIAVVTAPLVAPVLPRIAQESIPPVKDSVQTKIPPPIPATTASIDLPVTAIAAPVPAPAVSPAPSAPLIQQTPPTAQIASRVPNEKLKLSMQLSALVAETPATRTVVETVAPKPPTTPGRTTVTNVPVRQVAADETVAAARTLWNDGSRAAAVATVREALSAAESAGNGRVIAPLARELARLHVADSNAQAGLDLLNRFESQFAQDADALALRGNAEQRLSRHAEAAASYQAALKMRPNEGKWMLGAAISLAAVGKIDEAQAWVEKAREREVVTPVIAAYLQQLGLVGRK